MTYQCFNREAFAPSISVQDGWATSWARRMVDVEFLMDQSCVYSTSDLGQADKQCIGCSWRANGQADTGAGAPEADMHMGDSLAGIRQGESGQLGIAGQGDVGNVADAAEHSSTDQQARAAEKLEAVHPNSAIYRRSE